MWATRRIHERGTKPEHLARIAAKNWNNGALNPMSQRRPDKVITAEKVLGSRMVAWPLTAMMSCPIGDGAACAIVGRADLAKKLRPDRPVVRVLASDLQSERYERGHLFMGPVVGPARMTVDTSTAVYEGSGVGPKDLDLVQVHDAFVIEELEYYELLGLCGRGEAEACIERGDFERGGRVPVSTDGGLIARVEERRHLGREVGAADDSVDAELARLARIDRAVAEAHQHDLGCRGATLEGGTDLQSAAPRQEEVHQHEIGPAPRPDEKEHAYDGSDGYREIP